MKTALKQNQPVTALYCRLSRDDAQLGESDSIANQREMLTRYAQEHGFYNTRCFVDDGYTGTNFDRPAFKEMMTEAESGRVETILVKDLSRFGRDLLDGLRLIRDTLPDLGVRVIAISDNVDTEKGLDDFAPFRMIFNEWFPRDTSRKIRAVFQNKAEAGKHVTGYPCYGYKWDSPDKNHWVPDEESASIVREIFHLCMCGNGPTQIAHILNERGIISPSIHSKKNGVQWKDRQHKLWSNSMIALILERMEYLGHTVSCRTYKKSYRSKAVIKNPEDKWIITKNTHETIIDAETWEHVQQIRQNRRRPTKIGEFGILNGLMYCADCGAKLRMLQKAASHLKYYICAKYAGSGGKECSTHSTPRHEIEAVVLQDIQSIVTFAREHEREFVNMLANKRAKESNAHLRAMKNEHTRIQKRLTELDVIIPRTFEANALGRLSDEQFAKMHAGFEAEQVRLQTRAAELAATLATEQKHEQDTGRFLKLVREYGAPEELTAEIARVFIDKIIVHAAVGCGKAKSRKVEICYNHIGFVEEYRKDESLLSNAV
jgi:DNA invertase Pin-like site-specific DNA recombinase